VFIADTNILIYAADADSPPSFHRKCHASLRAWRSQTSFWYVTWGILYEFLRVTTHPRVFQRPWPAARAWQFITDFHRFPFLEPIDPTT